MRFTVLLGVVRGARKSLWEINAHLRGDILRRVADPGDSRRMMAAVRRDVGGIRWPGNTIPYVLSSEYTSVQKRVLRTSFNYLEKVSCFKFVERTNQFDYLNIEPLDGCYSFVGRIGGQQNMSLAVDCLVDYIIWHEMLHVIGFEHEHQRPDRDSYISVLFDNVNPDQIGNFDKIPSNELEGYNRLYDYKSIMHYDGMAFGMSEPVTGKRKVTMVPLQPGIELIDNMSLTELDIAKLNQIGNCSVRNRSTETCRDKSKSCPSYMRKGLCKKSMYKSIMKQTCERTCNLCLVRI
uniref:Metalloendopeptidase n=1 Tax=Steinernema glaseri TaxID=37863 RepID=A0A1I8A436_9BILA